MRRAIATWVVGLVLIPRAGLAQDEESEQQSAAPDKAVHVELAGGVAGRTLFGLDILAGEVDARVGGQISRSLSLYWTASYLRGRTPAGLPTDLASIGTRLDFGPYSHVHAGAGVGADYFDLGGSIQTLGVDLLGFIRWDFWSHADTALFAEGSVDLVDLDTFHNAALLWGPTFSLGVRL